MTQSLQPTGREFESTCVGFFLLPLFDSFNFIYFRCIIDVPRPVRNEILDHSISKG